MSGEDAIAQLGAKIDAHIAETRAQFDAHIAETRAQFDAQTTETRAQLDAQTTETWAHITPQYAAQNAKLDALIAELRTLCDELRVLRLMFAGMLTLLGILTAGFVAIAVLAFDEPAPPAAIAVQTASAEDTSGAPSQAVPPIAPPSEESTGSPTE